jgi:hypothetical protein
MEKYVIGIIVVGILFIIAVVIAIIASPKYKKVVATLPLTPTPSVSSVPVKYSLSDFAQLTGDGTDLPNQPITGTLWDCQTACTDAGNCIGFTRAKKDDDKNNAQCYLKIAYPNKTMNHKTWYTYSKII